MRLSCSLDILVDIYEGPNRDDRPTRYVDMATVIAVPPYRHGVTTLSGAQCVNLPFCSIISEVDDFLAWYLRSGKNISIFLRWFVRKRVASLQKRVQDATDICYRYSKVIPKSRKFETHFHDRLCECNQSYTSDKGFDLSQVPTFPGIRSIALPPSKS